MIERVPYPIWLIDINCEEISRLTLQSLKVWVVKLPQTSAHITKCEVIKFDVRMSNSVSCNFFFYKTFVIITALFLTDSSSTNAGTGSAR